MFDVTADGGDTINVGARVFEGDFPLDPWAWMDDSQTDIQDGYIEDNDMLFRILDKSERNRVFCFCGVPTGDGDGLYTQISNIQTISAVMLTFSNETSLALDFKEGGVANRTLSVKQVEIITEEFPDVPEFEKVVFYYDIELDVEDFQVDLTFSYTDDMITGLGLNEDSLAVNYYDTTEVRWQIVVGTINKSNNTITVNTDHFSL